MPTYDYVCTNCGHMVEVTHGVHLHGPSTCTECGGPMKKVFAPPTVHYKGSGWARKESSSGGRRGHSTSGESASSSDGPKDSSTAGSTEAKSAPPSKDTD